MWFECLCQVAPTVKRRCSWQHQKNTRKVLESMVSPTWKNVADATLEILCMACLKTTCQLVCHFCCAAEQSVQTLAQRKQNWFLWVLHVCSGNTRKLTIFFAEQCFAFVWKSDFSIVGKGLINPVTSMAPQWFDIWHCCCCPPETLTTKDDTNATTNNKWWFCLQHWCQNSKPEPQEIQLPPCIKWQHNDSTSCNKQTTTPLHVATMTTKTKSWKRLPFTSASPGD